MTDPMDKNRPIIPPEDVTEQEAGLPEHEIDRESTVGGGVMGSGGTAVDRGTGTVAGKAQGPSEDDDRDDPLEPDEIDDDAVVPPKPL
jgi:hypothetical protein